MSGCVWTRQHLMHHPSPPPLVLLACSDEWLGRSIGTVFEQNGYAVARVSAGAPTIRLARRANPDVVVLEEGNGDLGALRVCRALGDDPLFDHTVPIVVTATAPVTRATRHAAYAAGAWEYCSHPVDLEALMLKLATFRRARSQAAGRPTERFIDRETGLYTAAALTRCAEQVGALARRRHEPLACVTLGLAPFDHGTPGPRLGDEERDETFAMVAEFLRLHSRKSDIVGHVGESRLAILAPDTDAGGARMLVTRLRRALEQSDQRAPSPAQPAVRAGYSAVSDLADSGLDPADLLLRASCALDHLQQFETADGLMSFDEVPPGRAD